MFKMFKKIKEKQLGIQQLETMKRLPFGTKGNVDMNGKKFQFNDAGCFYVTYKEIIQDEIYQFKPSTKNPVIIDCGANMGLSVLYFSKNYPTAKIIAFEPEEPIFNVLENNVRSFDLKNVTIYKKAVWDSVTTLDFYSDKGMGGSVINVYSNQEPAKVETVLLSDYLHEKIDFLKMDIEGAEYQVLKSCGNLIQNVEHLFVEYHSFVNREQKLDDLLLLLKENGFRYHLRQSFSREHPFIDKGTACENMDMAITVFAYKN